MRTFIIFSLQKYQVHTIILYENFKEKSDFEDKSLEGRIGYEGVERAQNKK
jgi:hypothetical protein